METETQLVNDSSCAPVSAPNGPQVPPRVAPILTPDGHLLRSRQFHFFRDSSRFS